MSQLRALPTLIRVGFAEAIAYRAEMLVWVFATTMPFVNLALWSAIASVAPVAVGNKNWESTQFVAYFLSVFIVRQLISSWACWEINWEIRQGTLAMRLLRPIHPIVSFMMQNLAYMPMRWVVTLPVAVAIGLTGARASISHDWVSWALWPLALAGAWLITFFANIAIGALSFYMDSSIKLMDVWLAAFFVFSGYSFPPDLFPAWLRAASEWLPFQYQIALPVDLMLGTYDAHTALLMIGKQWLWAGAFIAISLVLWRGGVKRFQSFGG